MNVSYEKYSRFRDLTGETDYKIAQKAGVGRSTISDWKTGKHMPNTDNMKICNALSIKLTDLIDVEMSELTEQPSIHPVVTLLADTYRYLPKKGKEEMLNMCDYLGYKYLNVHTDNK